MTAAMLVNAAGPAKASEPRLRVSQAFQKDMPALRADLLKVLTELGLADRVALQTAVRLFMPAYTTVQTVDGAYLARVIYVALEAADGRCTMKWFMR